MRLVTPVLFAAFAGVLVDCGERETQPVVVVPVAAAATARPAAKTASATSASASANADASADASVSAPDSETATSADAATASSNSPVTPLTTTPSPNVITLERTACFGFCPSYTVAIHEDGLVEYDGRQYVHTHGHKTWHVPPADARALFARFVAAGYAKLAMPATCAAIATDNPSANTSWIYQRATHRVEHYYGNRCAPAALTALEGAIDDAAATKGIVQCKPAGYCNRP